MTLEESPKFNNSCVGFREGKRASVAFSEYVSIPEKDILKVIAKELDIKGADRKKLLSDERYRVPLNADTKLSFEDKDAIFVTLWAHRHEKITFAHIEMAASYADVSKVQVVNYIMSEIISGKLHLVRCKCSRNFRSMSDKKTCPICSLIKK